MHLRKISDKACRVCLVGEIENVIIRPKNGYSCLSCRQTCRGAGRSAGQNGILRPNVPTNIPRCGSIRGSKRHFKAKRADKHAALRVNSRVKTASMCQTKLFGQDMYHITTLNTPYSIAPHRSSVLN